MSKSSLLQFSQPVSAYQSPQLSPFSPFPDPPSSSSSPSSTSLQQKHLRPCLQCEQYRTILSSYEHSVQQKQQNYEKVLKNLQNHNKEVIVDTDTFTKNLQKIVLELQMELCSRDQIIKQLNCKINNYISILEQQTIKFESAMAEIKTKFCKGQRYSVSNSNKIRVMEDQEELYKETIIKNQSMIRSMQKQIAKQISQKSAINKTLQETITTKTLQVLRMQKQSQTLQSQIRQKDELIRYLSNSNNEVRAELIELKSMKQIGSFTWETQKQFLSQIQIEQSNQKLKKNNLQLKFIVHQLQTQLENLANETQKYQKSQRKNKPNNLYCQQKNTFQLPIDKFNVNQIGYGPLYIDENGKYFLSLNYTASNGNKLKIPGVLRIHNSREKSQIMESVNSSLQEREN